AEAIAVVRDVAAVVLRDHVGYQLAGFPWRFRQPPREEHVVLGFEALEVHLEVLQVPLGGTTLRRLHGLRRLGVPRLCPTTIVEQNEGVAELTGARSAQRRVTKRISVLVLIAVAIAIGPWSNGASTQTPASPGSSSGSSSLASLVDRLSEPNGDF